MQGKGVWVSSMGVPQDEKFSKFFGPKKIGHGGSLGKGVWEPTPHLL